MYGSWPLPIGSGHRTGYIARPDAAGRFPVVLVLSSIDGLTSTEKDICRRLARSGLVSIAIDFYRDPGVDPIASYDELPDARALTDIDEIHAFVASDDVAWAVSANIGVIGLDVGGRFALLAAATRPWVRSLGLAYTPLTGDEERSHRVADYLSNLPVPVLAVYGADDGLIAASTVDEAQRRNDHGQWLLYAGAGHGFLDIESETFDQAAADDALARFIAFFKASLEPAEEIDLG
jgi:carboxymethylenebutenolidase